MRGGMLRMTFGALAGTGLLLAGSALLTLLLVQVPFGSDWTLNYYPTVRAYLGGATRLYDGGVNTGFYYPPWVLLLLFPFSALGDAAGLTAFRLASLGALALVASSWAPAGRIRPVTAALAVGSLYTLDMLVLGQVVAWVTLGIWLAWRGAERRQPWALVLGFALASLKPQLTALPLLAAALATRSWSARLRAHAGAGLIALGLLSVAISGPDWPVRWLEYVRTAGPARDPVMSLYREGLALGVPLLATATAAIGVLAWLAWRFAHDAPGWPLILLLTTAANTALSPYVHDYDLPLLMAVAWPTLAVHATPFAVLAYLLHPLFYLSLPVAGGARWLHPLVTLLLLGGAVRVYTAGQNKQQQARDRHQAEEAQDLASGERVEEQRVPPLQSD